MFNSTLTGNARVWFDGLPKETIDSYDDSKKIFLENYLQQKKCIKDPVEIHNIRQRDGESTEEFVRRYKLECRDVKGAPKCMKISGFMHGITNPELIKRLHDKIPKSVDEMMRQEANQKQNFKKGGFRDQKRSEGKQDRFALLTKTPKEIFALDKGKFKAPPPMTTSIEEMLKARKLSHLVKEIKQNNGKEQPKVTKKGENAGKYKAMDILMNTSFLPLSITKFLPVSYQRLLVFFNWYQEPWSGADNRPPMLEKDMYDSWKSIMELYMLNKQNGRMILESVESGPLIWPSIEENGVTRPKKYSELSATEALQADCDIKDTLPRLSIKGQILADFIVERPEGESPDTLMGEEEELPEPWILFTDGSSCTNGSGAGLILTNPEGMKFTYALRFRFDATNNEAEYEALIAGLKIAEQMGVKNLQANVDSRNFKAFSIKQVPRSENKKADALSKIASTSFAYLSKQVLVEELKEKSISTVEVLAVVEKEGDTWMTPIFKYLMDRTLLAEVKKARAVKRKSWRFSIINGTLYKKSFLEPWLRCVGPLQANYVLREIHEGSCSMHAGTRSVVAKALRIGYYWPTMHEDARKRIRACQDCQVHKPIPRSPQQKLSPITSPWPFYKWGIDITGPFSEGPRKVKFLIVAIDYFTKWIEEKPVATITGNQIKKFVWDNIVCRFGLPGEIILDNGKQLQDNPFKDWCEKLCILQHFASVKHPQTNGLVERANRSLGEGIKARLDERSKNWMEELPHVL
ncbi:reverse transcriptase domain-containing protein [Tanacetum coccineum]